MVNQYVWVGIAVGIFVAGIGIGYAALQGDSGMPGMMNFGAMSPQQMQQAMQDPDFRQQMRDSMGQNRQFMQDAMQDSGYMQQMHSMMMENRQHMQGMMSPMMNTMMDDPEMRQQMMDTMSQHQAMMQSMMQNSEMMGMMTNQNMMGSGMMNQGTGMMPDSGMGQMMIQDPELREQFNQQKLEHQKIMNELMSADMSDPTVQQKIKDQVEEHQKFMDELMKQISTQTNP